MLAELPPEILDLVIEKLAKGDLKALSEVSKHIRALVARTLWQSITIKPGSEYSLHRMSYAALTQIPLEFATQLQFCSEFRHATTLRCPHAQGYDDRPWNTDDGEDSGAVYQNAQGRELPRFNHLSNNAKMLLRRLKSGQLHGFGWDLGTCVSSEILGTDGIISLMHPLIRSLSLTTNFTCRHFSGSGCDIDLSPFRQIRSLSWKAPHVGNLDTLSAAIRRNSSHLQKLELNFINWYQIQDTLGYGSDGVDENGAQAQNYFAEKVLGLNKHTLRPLLPAIRVLSLTQVPLVASIADAINFDTLTSLTLRICPGSEKFLDQVLQHKFSIKLTTFEIQIPHTMAGIYCCVILARFLDAFEGLEEFFVSQPGHVQTLDLWKCLSGRHAGLKRFVHHQRTIDTDEESATFEEEIDHLDLSISRVPMREIKYDPSKNPLAELDLEFIGLACLPERLKYLLLPFKSKTSLKVLHIRQSSSDLEHWESWAVRETPIPGTSGRRSHDSSDASDYDSDNDQFLWPDDQMENFTVDEGDWPVTPEVSAESLTASSIGSDGAESAAGGDEVRNGPRLADEFRRFVNWAFGLEGIASLQFIIFGDFAYGGRLTRIQNNLVYRRCRDGISTHRFVREHEREWIEIRDAYRTAIEACPVEPLLE